MTIGSAATEPNEQATAPGPLDPYREALRGYDGARLETPPLPPVPLKARGRQR